MCLCYGVVPHKVNSLYGAHINCKRNSDADRRRSVLTAKGTAAVHCSGAMPLKANVLPKEKYLWLSGSEPPWYTVL